MLGLVLDLLASLAVFPLPFTGQLLRFLEGFISASDPLRTLCDFLLQCGTILGFVCQRVRSSNLQTREGKDFGADKLKNSIDKVFKIVALRSDRWIVSKRHLDGLLEPEEPPKDLDILPTLAALEVGDQGLDLGVLPRVAPFDRMFDDDFGDFAVLRFPGVGELTKQREMLAEFGEKLPNGKLRRFRQQSIAKRTKLAGIQRESWL